MQLDWIPIEALSVYSRDRHCLSRLSELI